MEEIDEIKRITGKEPVLCGFELLSYSPNIRYETGDEACRTEIDENRGTLAQAHVVDILSSDHYLEKGTKTDYRKEHGKRSD